MLRNFQRRVTSFKLPYQALRIKKIALFFSFSLISKLCSLKSPCFNYRKIRIMPADLEIPMTMSQRLQKDGLDSLSIFKIFYIEISFIFWFKDIKCMCLFFREDAAGRKRQEVLRSRLQCVVQEKILLGRAHRSALPAAIQTEVRFFIYLYFYKFPLLWTLPFSINICVR